MRGLRHGLEIIEGEFERDWLVWKSANRERGGQRSRHTHPVAVAWSEARELLPQMEAGAPVAFEDLPNIAFLSEVATDLETAQNVPNFARAIRPRLKTGEFEKAQFEMHIGALYRRTGLQVEFVPPSGKERMADLKVIRGQHEIFIECTRKDPYQPDRHDDSAARKSLGDDILALQRELSASLEIIAVVLGTLDPRSSVDVLTAIRHVIEKGERGMWTRAIEGIGFIVRELTPGPLRPDGGVGLAIPATLLSPKRLAFSEGTYATDEEGRPYIAGEKRVAVYVIDSHRLTSVVDSFRRKRGQIPKDSSGVVYANLDVSHVAEGDVDLYMQMAQTAVRAALTTPPGNPQIGAVILMTTLTPRPFVLDDGQVARVPSRGNFWVRNPHGALPDGFIIPDASPVQEPKAHTKS